MHDSHIQVAIEDIEKYGENKNGSTLYFVPSLSHFIKLAPQNNVESQLNQSDATRKHHIVFFVNDCNGNQGSGEGSHWSLLVYERDRNTWYHMDSGKNANAPYAKQIMYKVNKYFVNQGSLINPKTNYVECSCTQQQNGYDCGPLAILFAKNITKKIANGESLHTCKVDENKTHYVRDRIHTQINNKLWYLEKGEVRTNNTMNHDKDVMVKRKVCWFYKYRECKFGRKCSHWHPPDVRQKERDRYRDGLFDSRDNGRPVNGRHNGERLPHNPHNSTYSSQSRGQPNTNANRYKDVAHYGDREFFRRDWPTPMEEKLLRTIREVMRTESGGWGPAGW